MAHNDALVSLPHLKVLLCTANLGNAEPTLSDMAAWLAPQGACASLEPLSSRPQAQQILQLQFDVIVIGLQEAVWKSSSGGGAAAAAAAKRSSKAEQSSASKAVPISTPSGQNAEHSAGPVMMLNESQAIAETDLVDATGSLLKLIQQTIGDDYVVQVNEHRGQMRLLLFAHRKVQENLTDLQVRGENTGLAHIFANKGGILCSMRYQHSTRITFCSAHLAAHEGSAHYLARCDNLREILRGCKTFHQHENLDTTLTSHHMFVMGDLNFRLVVPTCTVGSGAEKEQQHDEQVQRVLALIKQKDWSSLYQWDELHQGIQNNDLLCNFHTLPCLFSPTFKVHRESGFRYNEQRTPSYTDRILWMSADGLESAVQPLAYEACPEFTSSDHKPVRGAFAIVSNATFDQQEVNEFTTTRNSPFQPLRIVFKNLECADLPSMDIDGKSDPYLVFLWDSETLFRDNRSKNVVKASRLGLNGKWPSTKFISKNLNPRWSEEMDLVLQQEPKTGDILWIMAMDYDMSTSDDLMCSVPLNVKGLVRRLMGEQTTIDTAAIRQPLVLDQPMMKYGKSLGKIKMSIEISRFDTSDRQIEHPAKKNGIAGFLAKAIGIGDKRS